MTKQVVTNFLSQKSLSVLHYYLNTVLLPQLKDYCQSNGIMEKYEQKSDCHPRIKNRHIKKNNNCDHFSFIFVGDACPLGGMPHRQNYKLVLLFFKQSQRTGTQNQHEGYKRWKRPARLLIRERVVDFKTKNPQRLSATPHLVNHPTIWASKDNPKNTYQ